MDSTTERKGKIARASTTTTSAAEAASQVSAQEEHDSASTIYVFGFPTNTDQVVLDHFAKYGAIRDRTTAGEGNWLTIRYESPAMAQQALKSNGQVIAGHMIGVKLQQQAQQRPQEEKGKKVNRLIPLQRADLYKKPTQPAGVKLGSGQSGLSVLSLPSVNPNLGNVTVLKDSLKIVDKVKEFIFEW
ncbi:hypothetical protein BCR43DRAFT_497367 [Syncephalastrum racemosum]|uniref:RRM Nup35-type domain-containing protein n=1 Tax=Syncephalastrum racemosum TaxID=13706 RepID=A0A1X2H279_SYNRA|nr:hypothetical protein BCR43DRAFT_497367 [Syncephalastrum racemosum]